MNGPQHYAEAERLLEQANDSTPYDEAEGITAQAHVHATLALAAATAAPRSEVQDFAGNRMSISMGWEAVTQ